MSSRCHWPMHGPHALASTVAPIASRSASRPSRSMVARTCSEPGVMSSGVFTRRPAALAWRGDVRGAADVLVRRVGARPDQRVADVDRVALLARRRADLGDRTVEVGGVRTDEVRLELVEVDVDHAVEEPLGVVHHLGVDAQVLGVRVGEVGQRLAPGRLQVRGRAGVVGEQRARGADLGAHVADRGLAGGRDRLRAGAEVLDDRAGAALHGEDAGDLEDDVLRRGPARELAAQVHADHLRARGC